jgi:hypothetical protein
MKKRQLRKIFKIVSQRIDLGEKPCIKHVRIVQEAFSNFFSSKYENDFRPWWYAYEQFNRWSELDFAAEHKRFFEKWEMELRKLSGINLESYFEYLRTLPKRPKRERKFREKPQQEIRKLRNPEEFRIARKNGYEAVVGEKCFSVNGYDFFIRHDRTWIVSCVTTGCRICSDSNYKQAVKDARLYIELYFDSYVKSVEKWKREREGVTP